MKKDKKKGASKKTWVVDCRTDSAFDFALKVLKEANNDNYPRELRANFVLIAYKNSCEAIARAQTDPYKYKLKSAFKLFIRNLKAIYKKCDEIYDDVRPNSISIDLYKYTMIENPFDYIDINYDIIERDLSIAQTQNIDTDRYYTRFNYPRIYETGIVSRNNEDDIAIITQLMIL